MMTFIPILKLPIGETDIAHVRALILESGAVLLRGNRSSVASVEALTQKMFRQFHQPANRSDLRRKDGDGYSSLVRKENRLLGHAEGYYRPCLSPPDICVFYCEKAPQVRGGETFLIDGAELYRSLPNDLAQRLEVEGVIYESLWARERWQDEFGVEDVGKLREMLDRDDRCEYELKQDSQLHLLFKAPAILQYRERKRFINGMLAHLPEVEHPRYKAVSISAKPSNRMHWGRGGQLDNHEICCIIDAHDSVMIKHRWLDGDVLLFDNHMMLHGREAMDAPSDRIIYSRFGYWG